MRLAVVLLLTASALAQWQPQESPTKESLRGVSIFDSENIWASGTHGTYLMTKDGGKTWNVGKVPGAEDLDFRGVKVFQEDVFLLSSGTGDKSRIYHRRVGKPWELEYTNPEPKGFFDCMVFADERHAVVIGDPVNGKFQILRTRDAGQSWQFVDPKNIPPALDGEGSFAASNSCVTTNGTENVWFSTGGPAARVFRSTDGGETWAVADTPIVRGAPSQGTFSIAFRDGLHGVVAGGDYQHPEQTGSHLARTEDGGKTWKLADATPQKFYSAVAYVGGTTLRIIAVGPAGFGLSRDELDSWSLSGSEGFHALDSKQGVTFAVGANGKMAMFKP